MSIRISLKETEAHLLIDALDHWNARLCQEPSTSAAFNRAGDNVKRQITDVRAKLVEALSYQRAPV